MSVLCSCVCVCVCVCGCVPHSQLQDEHNVGAVLVDVVQCDDVGVLDPLQDGDLALDLLAAHPAAARSAQALLDELGGVIHARALLLAPLHDGKLPTTAQNTEHMGEGSTQHRNASQNRNYYYYYY